MTYDQLSAFLYVAREGSFTAASAALHKSQPAVSKLVRNLEQELGLQLFDRSAYRATLTEAGQRFYERERRAREHRGAAQLRAHAGRRAGAERAARRRCSDPARTGGERAARGAEPLRDGSHRAAHRAPHRSEEHTSELQSQSNLVCRLLL